MNSNNDFTFVGLIISPDNTIKYTTLPIFVNYDHKKYNDIDTIMEKIYNCKYLQKCVLKSFDGNHYNIYFQSIDDMDNLSINNLAYPLIQDKIFNAKNNKCNICYGASFIIKYDSFNKLIDIDMDKFINDFNYTYKWININGISYSIIKEDGINKYSLIKTKKYH
jgi:hypothetical protein